MTREPAPCPPHRTPATPMRPATIGGVLVTAAGAVTATGRVRLSLLDLLVLLGVAVVLPLALPRGWSWSLAAASALVAAILPVGWPAAAFVVPWIVIGAAMAIAAFGAAWARPTLSAGARSMATGFSVVAGAALFCSRLGATPLSIREPILELTAVHFTYAGVGAMVLASRFVQSTTGRSLAMARVSTMLIGTAPVVVAAGFLTHRALPQVGGAILLTIGVWLTASLEIAAAFDRRRPLGPRALLFVSGVAIWIPMVLAVAWAAGQHWDLPALSIDAMIRTHGVVNALAFVIGGLLGTHTHPRADRHLRHERAREETVARNLG